LLPCYNAEKYLKEAIDSLLEQTYSDLEIIAINDGSTDKTATMLAEFQSLDSRIVFVNNEKNLGLIDTLNKGLQLCTGKYIARMDADDISDKHRISKQVLFLENNPDIDFVSCAYTRFTIKDRPFYTQNILATNPESILFAAHLYTPVCHAAIMGKQSTFANYRYLKNEFSLHVEDYELWTKMLREGVRFANINEPLYHIRSNKESVSNKYETIQIANFISLAKLHFDLVRKTNAPIEYIAVLVNRLSKNTSEDAIKWAFIQIDGLQKTFASVNNKTELSRISNMHKADILFQFFKKENPLKALYMMLSLIIKQRSLNLISHVLYGVVYRFQKAVLN
jgi:glycosyltransferase involved in cell wall biosynthesis